MKAIMKKCNNVVRLTQLEWDLNAVEREILWMRDSYMWIRFNRIARRLWYVTQEINELRVQWPRIEWELAKLRKDASTLVDESTPKRPLAGESAPQPPKWYQDFKWSPFPRIPNVRDFKVSIEGMDSLYAFYGIEKRRPSSVEVQLYENHRVQRYAAWTINRIRTCRDSSLKWRMIHLVMSRSMVFSVMALWKAFPRFHRELPMSLCIKWIQGVQKISREYSTSLDYSRVYIPKPNGKWRPLGVPTPVWRLYFTLLSWFLVDAFNDTLPSWQHGFRPGLGTLSAWRVILDKVVKARYIYEFDLKGFFDSVDTRQVLRHLKRLGLAPQMVRHLKGIVEKPAQLPPEPKLPEFGNTMKALRLSPDFKEFLTVDMLMMRIDTMMGAIDTLRTGRPSRRYSLAISTAREWFKGFPQGANISPFLSIFALVVYGDPSFAELLMYADDGLFYSRKKFFEEQVKEFFGILGLEISPGKSGWVRDNWKWVKPLKFLGLQFDGLTGKLASETRNGARLEFDKHELVQVVSTPRLSLPHAKNMVFALDKYVVWGRDGWWEQFDSKREALARRAEISGNFPSNWFRVGLVTLDDVVLSSDVDAPKPWSWELLAKSKILGLLQSGMYRGSWHGKAEQDFRMSYSIRSWVHLRGPRITWRESQSMDFKNSTSFAFLDFVNLLHRRRRLSVNAACYAAGNITLDQYNQVRVSLGYKRLKRTMYRHITLKA